MDAEACSCRPCRQRKELISRHFAKPSDGLEPSTPSLPFSAEAGSEGKRGKPRARKPSKKRNRPEND